VNIDLKRMKINRVKGISKKLSDHIASHIFRTNKKEAIQQYLQVNRTNQILVKEQKTGEFHPTTHIKFQNREQ